MVPSIYENDIEAITQVLHSELLVQGKHVEMLERNFENFTSSTHAIAVSNGSAGRHLALMALDVRKGDESIKYISEIVIKTINRC